MQQVRDLKAFQREGRKRKRPSSSHGMAVRLRTKQWDDQGFDWKSWTPGANARAPAIPSVDAIQGATMTKEKNTAAKAQSAATRTVQPKPQARKAKSKLEQL